MRLQLYLLPVYSILPIQGKVDTYTDTLTINGLNILLHNICIQKLQYIYII